MTPQVAEALEASITKWERNMLATHPEDYTISVRGCPLCVIFHMDGDKADRVYEKSCEGCPVAEKSGKKFCTDTPYQGAFNARRTWYDLLITNTHPERIAQAKREAIAAAQLEIDFLKSLRV